MNGGMFGNGEGPEIAITVDIAMLTLFPLLAAAITLAIGRERAAWPMALGLVLIVPLEVFYNVVLIGVYWPANIGLVVGAMFGQLRMLRARISLGVLMLAIPTSFTIGQWIAAWFPM